MASSKKKNKTDNINSLGARELWKKGLKKGQNKEKNIFFGFRQI